MDNESKIRAWAEIQAQIENKDQSVLRTLSNAIIYGLSGFSNPLKSVEEQTYCDKINNNIQTMYSGDSSLFEIGCYLYFCIDLWHVRNDKEIFRDKIVYGYLIRSFLELIEATLNIKNSHEIFQNRLKLYGDLARTKPYRIRFYLTQLVSRTCNNTLPIVHNFDTFTINILGFVEDMSLALLVDSFDIFIVPACIKSIEKFYTFMSPELRSFLLSGEHD